MEKNHLIMKEAGRNWLRQGSAIFLIMCCGIVGLVCIVAAIYAYVSQGNQGALLMAVLGLGIIALPFLPALMKEPATIEMLSQDGQLVIEKNHGAELRAPWSDITAISSQSVVGGVVFLHFTYTNSKGKRTTYHLNTKFLSKDDILSIARFIDDNWTGKYGKPTSINV